MFKMRVLFLVWSLVLSSGRCQYPARQELAPTADTHSYDDPANWDIRLSVPGEPGRDYPTLSAIPKTSFSCSGKEPGYYADLETSCQVFRVCTIGATYGFQSFLCPNGTLFNQAVFVCDWWMNVNCQGSQKYYSSNDNKFGNLKLGSSLMKDIKKMLTYSMNNPYKSDINSHQNVMQVYIPPSGQPFSGQLNQAFVPTQQLQLPSLQMNGRLQENVFSGSTPSPQYVPTDTQSQNRQFQSGQFHSGQFSNSNLNQGGAISTGQGQFEHQRNQINGNAYSGQNFNVQNYQQNGQFTNGQNPQYALAENAQSQYNSGAAFANALRSQAGNFANGQTFLGQGQSHFHNGDITSTNFANVETEQYRNDQSSHFALPQNAQQHNNAETQHNQFANSQSQFKLFQNNEQNIGQLKNFQNYQFSNTQPNQNTQNNGFSSNAFQAAQQSNFANANNQYNRVSNTDGRQNEVEITFTKQQFTYPSQYDKQYTYKISTEQSANTQQAGQLQEVKQNLAFVYDFLSNSINAAKSYESALNENSRRLQLATENILGNQFQNINADDLNEISEKISQLTTSQFKNSQYQTANLISTAQTSKDRDNTYNGLQNKYSNNEIQTNQQFGQLRSGQLKQAPEVSGNLYSSNFYGSNDGPSGKLIANPIQAIQHQQYNQVSNLANHNTELLINPENIRIKPNQEQPIFNQNIPQREKSVSKESAEVELVEAISPQSGPVSGKLQIAPTAELTPEVEQFNEFDETSKNVKSGKGVDTEFHKEVVGSINHPISDKNLITYKADKTFYVYRKYAGDESEKNVNDGQQFGQLRQAESDISSLPESNNNRKELVTTVQFIPSLSFQLDDENEQRELIKALQNQGAGSSYTSGVNQQFGQLRQAPENSVEYSVKSTTSNGQDKVQQFNSPATLYAGPSSYSAPQGTIGRLEPQRAAQLNVAPSPARLEDLEEETGYAKVTPSITFTY